MRLGEQPVEVLEELGQACLRVADDAVPKVGEEADSVEQDPGLPRRYREAVADKLISATRRLEQVLPLSAAPYDQIGPSWQELPRCGHSHASGEATASCAQLSQAEPPHQKSHNRRRRAPEQSGALTPSRRSNEPQNPHDALFRKTFSNVQHAKSALSAAALRPGG